jgi:Signal transduction histidine kinase
MKNTLYLKFIWIYLIFAFLSVFTIATLGSTLIENHLVDNKATVMYKEATSIANSQTARSYESSTYGLENLYNNLSSVAVYQSTQIWVVDTNGYILLNTNSPLNPDNPRQIEGFNPTSSGNKTYQIGDFFGSFSDEALSVISPITSNYSIKAYIVIHYPNSILLVQRDHILNIFYIILITILFLSLSILGVFTIWMYIPMRKITYAANQYADGNLDYELTVNTNDEIGYLASSLNYMSSELNKSEEYQKKFIANVSHDFRSPLTSIKGYVEAILDGTIPPDSQEKYLNIVIFETERLNKLTQGLLMLNDYDTKKTLLTIDTFDINNVIKTTATTFEGTCRHKKISIELILSNQQLYVKGDIGKIQQVLYNLIDNAIKFSEPFSSIYIETTEKYEKAFISVKDTGIGIPKDSLKKVFERFYKTDISRGKDKKGTGLGLSITKEIIQAHHENIDVISTEGVGTEFIFTLPRIKS